MVFYIRELNVIVCELTWHRHAQLNILCRLWGANLRAQQVWGHSSNGRRMAEHDIFSMIFCWIYLLLKSLHYHTAGSHQQSLPIQLFNNKNDTKRLLVDSKMIEIKTAWILWYLLLLRPAARFKESNIVVEKPHAAVYPSNWLST